MILVYLRRQDQVALSSYSTKLKVGSTADKILNMDARPDVHYYDYYKTITKWSNVFGADAIEVRLFETGRFVDSDLMSDFVASAGIEASRQYLQLENLNESLSWKSQHLIQRYNHKYLRFDDNGYNKFNDNVRKVLLQKLESRYPGEGELPAREEAIAFYGKFKKNNCRLAREWFDQEYLFTEDFSKYPERAGKYRLAFSTILYFDIMVKFERFRRFANQWVERLGGAKRGNGREKSKRTLYLHIGCHKTGSTSIQRALVLHKSYLLANGFSLFHTTPEGKLRAIGNVHPWIDFKEGENIKNHIVDDFFPSLEALEGDVVVTSEKFFYLYDEQDISSLIQKLRKSFDVIKIIVYIRRQDKLAISHHQQGSRRKAVAATKLYGSSSTALPVYDKALDQYLDLNRRLGIWADQVGDENMIIRLFEKSSLTGSDAVADFFALLGLKIQHRVGRENESNGFVKTKVGHLMNQLDFPVGLSLHVSEYLDNAGKMMPSRSEAIEFYERYKPGNSRLNERFHLNDREWLFDTDFDDYPEETDQDWSEDTANLAIKNTITALTDIRYVSDMEMERIASAAKKLRSSRPDLANRLFELVEKLKEKG
ncbi:MAG: hypothetical protein DRR42_15150 [Gammaproteobacteria bacterium]|nr:MAG: hypothetical protein DRR42_15150 [Gammaproteobacteria bacterium]